MKMATHKHNCACYWMACPNLFSFLFYLSDLLRHPLRDAECRKWGKGDSETTPNRLLDPASLHLPHTHTQWQSWASPRPVVAQVRGRWGETGGGECKDDGCLLVGARKVEQICNSVFHWEVWKANTQPPPTAICASVQDKMCPSAACWASLQLDSALILKPVRTTQV